MIPADETNPLLRWLAAQAAAGIIPTILEIEDAVDFTRPWGRNRTLEALQRVAINHRKAVGGAKHGR